MGLRKDRNDAKQGIGETNEKIRRIEIELGRIDDLEDSVNEGLDALQELIDDIDAAAPLGGNSIIYTNPQTITSSITIPATKNAFCAGPVALADGVTLTLESGATFVLI